MRVKATRTGFDGVTVRTEGDTFDLPDTTVLDPENDWFEKVEPKQASEDKSDKGGKDKSDKGGKDKSGKDLV